MNDAHYFMLVASERLQRKISYTAWREVAVLLQQYPTPELKLVYLRRCLAYLAQRKEKTEGGDG